MKGSRVRSSEPKHKLTLYVPLWLMEAFDRYVFDNKTTMTDTITMLLRDFLSERGYLYKDNQKERR